MEEDLPPKAGLNNVCDTNNNPTCAAREAMVKFTVAALSDDEWGSHFHVLCALNNSTGQLWLAAGSLAALCKN